LKVVNNASAVTSYQQHGNDLSTGSAGNRRPAGSHSDVINDSVRVSTTSKMRARNSGQSIASKNTQNNISLAQTAQNTLKSAENILQSMRDVAVRSAYSSNQGIELKDLDLDYSRLKFELCSLGRVRFNNVEVFKADRPTALSFPVYSDDRMREQVTIKPIEITIKPVHTDGLGSVATASDAIRAIDAVDSAIDDVSASRAELSDVQSRLEDSVIKPSTDTVGNGQGTGSQISSADMAMRAAELVRSSLASMPSAAASAQANAIPQGVLQLLN